ncbi:MAG: Crp/Fnr family transcriptional regulator [Desulfobacteraceae bacterium]|nr:Crp/Fnr family transcriptional regulator [Desulfobacteraceae bacterium]
MEKILSIIASIPLFNGLSPEHLQDLRNISVDKFYGKGKSVFMEGDECIGFFILASGKVKIFKLSPDGKEKILHIFGPGNPFGEVPVFSGGRFPANAETIVKSHLIFFPRPAFIDLLKKQPSLSINMIAILSNRLREFTTQIENLSLKEVPGRLASYLLFLISEQGREDVVTLPISKGQLASLLGTIPETLSRILTKMSAQQLIRVNGREIILSDLPGLQELSESGRLAE